jgi:hypothetical protein
MKKVFAILLTVGFLTAMSSCGDSAPKATDQATDSTQIECKKDTTCCKKDSTMCCKKDSMSCCHKKDSAQCQHAGE